MCHINVNACEIEGPNAFYQVGVNFEKRTTSEYVQEFVDEGREIPCLSCVPGWDLDFFLGDLQHEAALGIVAIAVGTTFIEMAETNAFGSGREILMLWQLLRQEKAS